MKAEDCPGGPTRAVATAGAEKRKASVPQAGGALSGSEVEMLSWRTRSKSEETRKEKQKAPRKLRGEACAQSEARIDSRSAIASSTRHPRCSLFGDRMEECHESLSSFSLLDSDIWPNAV